MNYAIIRNANYKMSQLSGISRHNERQNKRYGNKDIDQDKTHLNYHLKQPEHKSYEKEFYRIKDKKDLKGKLRLTGKKQSNVVCEFLVTSDKMFFDKIGKKETKRYFEEAYKFAVKKCGEDNIVSAVVHMDEKTPHMHLSYIPVVKGSQNIKNPLTGEISKKFVDKVNCSQFWKGQNSYGILQDEFYDHITSAGFKMERGVKNDSREEKREHIEINQFKLQTLENQVNHLETEFEKIDRLMPKKHIVGKKADLLVDGKQATVEQIDDIKNQLKKSVLNQQEVEKLAPLTEVVSDLRKELKAAREELRHVQHQSHYVVEDLKHELEKTTKILNDVVGYLEDHYPNIYDEMTKVEQPRVEMQQEI